MANKYKLSNGKKVAVATYADFPDFFRHPYFSDHLLVAELRKQGVIIDPVIWNSTEADWTKYDLVLIRSPHDYLHKVEEFYDWCSLIEDSGIPLYNNSQIIRWNSHKTYLLYFQSKGINVIPTVFLNKTSTCNLNLAADVMELRDWASIVVKPCTSANSYKTYPVYSRQEAETFQNNFELWVAERDMMIQKYVPGIASKGEWNLIYFDRKFSHAIIKYGIEGSCEMSNAEKNKVEAKVPPQNILEFSENVVGCTEGDYLYCRVDIIEHKGELYLMEFEAIECGLFLDYCDQAPATFADAILKRL